MQTLIRSFPFSTVGWSIALISKPLLCKSASTFFTVSFIYTTALSEQCLHAIETAYNKLKGSGELIERLNKNISLFQSLLSKKLQSKLISSSSPIQCIMIPKNETVKKVEADLQSKGFDIRAILHPTVEKGKERIRVCIHSFNTEEEIKMCVSSLEKLIV
jgi:8-amino-7-oxononanoate synthase